MGIVDALRDPLPNGLATALRVYVGLTGAVILLVAVTTSISGFARLAYSLGEHGQLPRDFGRLNRRTLVSPQAIVAAALISTALMIGTSFVHDDSRLPREPLQLRRARRLHRRAARRDQAALQRARPAAAVPRAVERAGARGRGAGAGDRGLGRHLRDLDRRAWSRTPARATAGPAWLAAGVVVYWLVRRSRGEGLLEHVQAPTSRCCPESEFTSILVPMKLGAIGEEMVATAVKLAQERDAHVEALFVIRVPLDQPLDAELDEQEEAAAASLAEARLLGDDNGVEVQVETIRARSIGDAIVGEASRRGAT